MSSAVKRRMRTSCWQIVEAPDTVSPAWKFWRKARTMLRKSMHGLFQKLWSSAATCASIMTCGMSSNGISRRSSMANVASSMPSAESTVEPCARSKSSISSTGGRPLVYVAYTLRMPPKSASAARPKAMRMMRGAAVDPGRRRGSYPLPPVAVRVPGPAAVVVGSFARQGSTDARAGP